MTLLLDTHIFLWWILEDPRLSPLSQQAIGSATAVYWSVASTWEVAIKYGLGRLPVPDAPQRFLPAQLSRNRVTPLAILDAHAYQAGALPPHHRDPFDRMLVAQAQVESLTLVSDDPSLRQYDVPVIW